MDAFSLLYSKFLLAKLCQFVFDSTSAESHWQFFSIRSCFIGDKCLSVVKRAWLSVYCVRQTQNLLIVVGCGSNPRPRRIY